MLHEVGADFVYVLDPDRPEGRTWDNSGLTEDVATGSAAGPTAAYLINHGLQSAEEPFRCIRAASWGDPAAWRCGARRRVPSGSEVLSRPSAVERSRRPLFKHG